VPDHVLAVAIGQPEIEDNDIWTVRRDALDRFGDRPGADEMKLLASSTGFSIRNIAGSSSTTRTRLVMETAHAKMSESSGCPCG